MKMMTRVKAISVGSTHDTCTPQSDRKKAPNIHDDCNDEDDFEQRDSRSGALFACLNIFFKLRLLSKMPLGSIMLLLILKFRKLEIDFPLPSKCKVNMM